MFCFCAVPVVIALKQYNIQVRDRTLKGLCFCNHTVRSRRIPGFISGENLPSVTVSEQTEELTVLAAMLVSVVTNS